MFTEKAKSPQSFKCDDCSKEFTKKYHLLLHIRSHTGEKPHSCSSCGKAFSQKGDLTRHMRLHSGEKPYKCDKCPRAFSHKSNLRQHSRLHTGERPYKCSVCGKCFSRRSILHQHQRLHSGLKPFKCQYCIKCFPRRGGLKQHIRVHTGDWPFKCDKCNKGFSDKSHLKCHGRVHSGEKPFKCNLCGKSFADKSNLNRHLKTHARYSNEICSKCGTSFACSLDAISRKLIKHHVCHTEAMKTDALSALCQRKSPASHSVFSCEHCQKAFSLKSNLTKHMRLHTGEKPYRCVYCKKSFSHKSNLTRHIKLHLSTKKYTCSICGIVFYNKGSLVQHNDLIHGIKDQHYLNHLPHNDMTDTREEVCDYIDFTLRTKSSSSLNDTESVLQNLKHTDEETPRNKTLSPPKVCKENFASEDCRGSVDVSSSMKEDEMHSTAEAVPGQYMEGSFRLVKSQHTVGTYSVVRDQQMKGSRTLEQRQLMVDSPPVTPSQHKENLSPIERMQCMESSSPVVRSQQKEGFWDVEDSSSILRSQPLGESSIVLSQHVGGPSPTLQRSFDESHACFLQNKTISNLVSVSSINNAQNPSECSCFSSNSRHVFGCFGTDCSDSKLHTNEKVKERLSKPSVINIINFILCHRKEHGNMGMASYFDNSKNSYLVQKPQSLLCAGDSLNRRYSPYLDTMPALISIPDMSSQVLNHYQKRNNVKNMESRDYSRTDDEHSHFQTLYKGHQSRFTSKEKPSSNTPYITSEQLGSQISNKNSDCIPKILPYDGLNDVASVNYSYVNANHSSFHSYTTHGNHFASRSSCSAIQYLNKWIAHAHARKKLMETKLLAQQSAHNSSLNDTDEFSQPQCGSVENYKWMEYTQPIFAFKEMLTTNPEHQYSGWLRFGGHMQCKEEASFKSELDFSNEFIDENCHI